jgi:membrane protein implicated in regulation of membrane protease activity
MSTALVIKIVLPLSLLALAVLWFSAHSSRPPRHLNQRQAAMIDSLHTAVPTGKEELK